MTMESIIFNETRNKSDTTTTNESENVIKKKQVLENSIMKIEMNKSKAYKLIDCIYDCISRDQNEIEKYLEENPDIQDIYSNYDFKSLCSLEIKKYQEKNILNHLNTNIEKYSFLFKNEDEMNFYKSQDNIINKVNVIFKFIDILHKQNDELNKEIKDIKSKDTDEINQLRKDIINLKNENNDLKVVNKNKETEVESFFNENKKLKEKISFNELKIKELENKSIITEREIKNKQSYQLKFEKENKKNKSLKKKNNELSETINDMKHNETKLIMEKENLLEKVNQLEQVNYDYAIKASYNEKKYLEKNKKLNSKIKLKGEEIKKLKSKIEYYRKKFEKESPLLKMSALSSMKTIKTLHKKFERNLNSSDTKISTFEDE